MYLFILNECSYNLLKQCQLTNSKFPSIRDMSEQRISGPVQTSNEAVNIVSNYKGMSKLNKRRKQNVTKF